MKIKTNIKNNFWKIYSESKYIDIHKKKIINKGKLIKSNYFEETILIYSIIMMLASAAMILKLNSIYAYALIMIGIIYLLFNIIKTYEEYKHTKEKKFEKIITIKEEGITYQNNITDKEYTIKWNLVKCIAVTKNSIVILTDKDDFIYLDSAQKNKLIKEIKKDVRIIDK